MGKHFYNIISHKSNVKQGTGLINNLINTLPFEAHIPGYNYCGPGTKLEKRLLRGDRGINGLDEACREHDIAYSNSKDLGERHKADSILIDRAWDRVKAGDSTISERAAAYFVTNMMKLKKKFGMGTKQEQKKKVVKKTLASIIKKATIELRKNKPLDLMNAVKVARNAVSKSMGCRKNVVIPRVIAVPKVGGFLPLVPILTALSAVGSLASGSAAIVKSINNAKMAKAHLEENQRHNRKMESVALGEGLYLQPYKKGYGISLTKNIKKQKRNQKNY